MSVDEAHKNRALAARLATSFPLLSDAGGAAAKAYEAWEEKPAIARAATFLIAKGGNILYRKVGVDKRDRPTIDEVLHAAPPSSTDTPPPPPAEPRPAPVTTTPAPLEDVEAPEPAEYVEGGSEALLERSLVLHGVTLDVLVPQPAERKPVVAKLTIDGAGPALKIGFRRGSYADYVQVTGEVLQAFPERKLAIVQVFLESGEDVFSRQAVTALVFLGEGKKAPKVLWRGEGSYQNLFGECEKIDVISFDANGKDAVSVMRHREVAVHAPADGNWISADAQACVAKAKQRKSISRVKLP